MNELSTEQKAKAYDEAIKKLQEALSPTEDGCTISGLTRRCIEEIFPELAEDEDEKIMKAIIEVLKRVRDAELVLNNWGVSYDDAIAWLEKRHYTEEDLDRAYKTADEVQYKKGWEDGVASVKSIKWSEEDEKTRGELIDAIQGLWDNDALPMPLSLKRKDAWIAWLEKQEQKPALSEDDGMFARPLTPFRERAEVVTRLSYVDDDLKPIAEFIMDYCLWDLRKDEWNQPVIVVPLFRVLDALIQRGKPYCEGNRL